MTHASVVARWCPSRRRLVAAATEALLALLLLAAHAVSVPAQSIAPPEDAALVLRPGDAVKLTVWKAPEFDGEFVVLPNGTLAHPYLRDVVVAGVPLRDAQAALEERVKTQSQLAQVVMQPLLRVVVGGEVRTPNVYRYPAGTSVAEAIVLAGGTTERANARGLVLIRDGRSVALDLTDPTGPATRMAIASGDRLQLPRRGGSFRETVLPYVSVLGAAASIATLFIRARH